MNLTTYYCDNVRDTLDVSLTFDSDYDMVVKGQESNFTKQFASFYVNYELTTNNRTVEVRNVVVRKGKRL